MYCGTCGESVIENARFCPQCGVEVVTSRVPPPAGVTAAEIGRVASVTPQPSHGRASAGRTGEAERGAADEELERFFEQITREAILDTVERLLRVPRGFHGDTGIRDYLCARLHHYGGAKLDHHDPRSGCATFLLQSEHYTITKYRNTGQSGKEARFDLALTRPPKSAAGPAAAFAENLEALFAFELGRNKSLAKIVDPQVGSHNAETVTGTSDVSKLYRDLKFHGLRQGWAIEAFDDRTPGAGIIEQALDICRQLSDLGHGKKLVVVFVEPSPHGGTHHLSSNDEEIQVFLLAALERRGVLAAPDLIRSSVPSSTRITGGDRWAETASVADVFGPAAALAGRIIAAGGMEVKGRTSNYVNLYMGSHTVAQLHPHSQGIALVLRSRSPHMPQAMFEEVPVGSLAGYTRLNKPWLDGVKKFERKGPAVAFLIPASVEQAGDDDETWKDIVRLLNHSKTLV